MKKWIRAISWKSPLWPTMFSAVIAPGAGQIMNGDFLKGLMLFSASAGAYLWFSKVVGDRLTLILPGTPDQWVNNQGPLRTAFESLVRETPGMFITFFILMALLWGYGVVDAFTNAKTRHRRSRNEIPEA